jgi:hypothetical protein
MIFRTSITASKSYFQAFWSHTGSGPCAVSTLSKSEVAEFFNLELEILVCEAVFLCSSYRQCFANQTAAMNVIERALTLQISLVLLTFYRASPFSSRS